MTFNQLPPEATFSVQETSPPVIIIDFSGMTRQSTTRISEIMSVEFGLQPQQDVLYLIAARLVDYIGTGLLLEPFVNDDSIRLKPRDAANADKIMRYAKDLLGDRLGLRVLDEPSGEQPRHAGVPVAPFQTSYHPDDGFPIPQYDPNDR